jgi:hypothetical protein
VEFAGYLGSHFDLAFFILEIVVVFIRTFLAAIAGYLAAT